RGCQPYDACLMSTPPASNTDPDAPTDDVAAQLSAAAGKFETSVDSTLGIEEEFAICDPETLDLQPRYPELNAIAESFGLGTAVAGELLASEIEFRTGRCESWGDAVTELSDIRRRVAKLATSTDAVLGASATHPWA